MSGDNSRVKNLTKRYNGANDGPLSPTRDRSFSCSPALLTRPQSGKGPNSKGLECVGETDVIYMKIIYYVSPCDAQKKQSQIAKTDAITDKPWFSDDDFEELAQKIKHVR